MTGNAGASQSDDDAKRFASDALTSVIGAAGGQLIYVVAIPVLARLYTPKSFGYWALFLAALATLPVIATLRFDIAIVTAHTNRVAREMLTLTLALSLIAGVVLELAVLLFAAARFGTLTMPPEWAWLHWLPVGVAGASLYAIGTSWWLRMRAYRTITVARVGLPLATVLLQIALVGMSNGLGIVAGHALAQTLSAIAIVVAIAPALDRRLLGRGGVRRSVAAVRRFRGLALYTTPYSLQGQLFRQAVVVILASMSSVYTSGLFVMAQRAVHNPLTLVAGALEQAIYPRLAQGPTNTGIHRLVAITMKGMAVLVGVGCAVMTVFAAPLVAFVLGPRWIDSAPYVVASCYAAGSLVVSSWIVRVFDIFGRQRLHLIIDLSCNAVVLAIFVAVLVIWSDPVWAVVALSAGMAIYYVFWTILAFRVAGIPTRQLQAVLLLGVLAWGATMLACLALSRLIHAGLAA